MKAAYVEFVDSATAGAEVWKDAAAVIENRPKTVRALGLVISESDVHITVASYHGGDEIGGDIAIPKCAITKLQPIELP